MNAWPRVADPDARSGCSPCVAVVAVGDPESPSTWSGTTAGILGALRELGVATEALDLTLPPVLEQTMLVAAAARTQNRFDAHSAALTMGMRSRIARRRMRVPRLDGVIQVGTTFSLPASPPYVTLEDMTQRQGSTTHPVFSRMSARAIGGWEERRRGVYAGARMCAVASRWAAESLMADYDIARERIAVTGLGANHREEAAAERAWVPPRFLFVGLDWQRKGGPSVVRTFSRLRLEQPDALLDVVGGHPPLREPGVTGHGRLLQTRTSDRQLLAELFSRATCLVMPSLVEPFGIVHIEAAAAGVPSIGSSVGGAGELIGSDGGLVVDPGDEQGLFEAMLRLADPDTARRMGEAALERSTLYTWPKVVERLLRALGLQAPDRRELAEFL